VVARAIGHGETALVAPILVSLFSWMSGWMSGWKPATLVSVLGFALGFALCFALPSAVALAATAPHAPDHPLQDGLSHEMQIALEQIAMQPPELHPSIIEVALHEGLILQLGVIWRDFEFSLEPLLTSYEEGERAALQDLLRHPGLLETLVVDGPQTEAELRRRVQSFPEPIRELAVTAGRDHYALLVALRVPLERAVQDFETMMALQAPRVERAFREVLAHPAAIGLLSEELATTQQLAGSARLDRAATEAGLSSLGRAVHRGVAEARAEAVRRAAAAEHARQEEEARERQRRAERRARRLYYGRYPYWGNSSCWWGDPYYEPYGFIGHRHCWYPWHRYRARWW